MPTSPRRHTTVPSLLIRRGGVLPRPFTFPVIPSQCSHWRGNPFPFASLCEGGVTAKGRDGGRDMPRHQPKGAFRAPARGTFAPGGKSTQKRRSNLRFENPLRAFTCCLSCLLFPREHCAVQISPKCCIVPAPLSAAAFALKCMAVQPWQEHFLNSGPWPPPTFAASRQRRDLIIANSPGGRFQRGRAAALPLWSFQGERIFKERGKSKSPFP